MSNSNCPACGAFVSAGYLCGDCRTLARAFARWFLTAGSPDVIPLFAEARRLFDQRIAEEQQAIKQQIEEQRAALEALQGGSNRVH